MNNEEQGLRHRTKQFALRILDLFCSLPTTPAAQILGRQLLKSGTSVGAHYREAQRARSQAEFISKIEGGLQELDETTYWLELLAEGKIVAAQRIGPLAKEADELIAMMTASAKTAKKSL